MGFLSLYAGTQIVDAETGELVPSRDAAAWWVELKRCLPKVDFDAAQEALMGKIGFEGVAGREDTAMRATADTVAYQSELVARAVVAWNLTDERDELLGVGVIPDGAPEQARAEIVKTTKASLELLPQPVFAALLKIVMEANQPKGALERAGFRNSGVGGPAGDRAGASDPEPVLA